MKYLLLAVFFCWGAAVLAQNSVKERLKVDFERGKSLSLAYIEAMPEEYFGFKASDSIMSFAEQMLHSAQGMYGLVSNGTGQTNPYAQTDLAKEPSFKTKQEVQRITAESYDFAIKGIEMLQPAKFDEVITRGPFNVTRIDWIYKAKEHNNHHRGQTAIYLRLKGITPPAYNLFK